MQLDESCKVIDDQSGGHVWPPDCLVSDSESEPFGLWTGRRGLCSSAAFRPQHIRVFVSPGSRFCLSFLPEYRQTNIRFKNKVCK